MNIHNNFKDLVINQLEAMKKNGHLGVYIDIKDVNVEPCKDYSRGDLSTNACLVLGQDLEFANRLASYLKKDPRVAQVDVVGKGFINIFLNDWMWDAVINDAVMAEEDYGKSYIGKDKSINIEYVSANPTGALHVGHARGAVFGDSLANLMAFSGYDVTREYYINDMGNQVNSMVRTVFKHYLILLGYDGVEFDDTDEYNSDVVKSIAQLLVDGHGNALVDLSGERDERGEKYRKLKYTIISHMMTSIKADLELLGVKHDSFFNESDLHNGKIKEVLDWLVQLKYVYEGVLPKPKGMEDKNWKEEKLVLFDSTRFGDDVDRPLTKSDGSLTYFAPDIAYHNDKINRKFDHLINVFGADHNGYIKRIKGAVVALTGDMINLDVKTVQLVKLIKDGKPFKMSKRAGHVVTLGDLLEHIPANVVRFFMLTRKNTSPLEFDFDKVLEQSKDNPVFYVNYAYSRINSIFDKMGTGVYSDKPISNPRDIDMVKKVAEFPRVVELATIHGEPHRIAFYLYELASMFHSLFHAGKDDISLNFIKNPNGTRNGMLKAVQITLENGMGILGVKPMLKM